LAAHIWQTDESFKCFLHHSTGFADQWCSPACAPVLWQGPSAVGPGTAPGRGAGPKAARKGLRRSRCTCGRGSTLVCYRRWVGLRQTVGSASDGATAPQYWHFHWPSARACRQRQLRV